MRAWVSEGGASHTCHNALGVPHCGWQARKPVDSAREPQRDAMGVPQHCTRSVHAMCAVDSLPNTPPLHLGCAVAARAVPGLLTGQTSVMIMCDTCRCAARVDDGMQRTRMWDCGLEYK